MKQITQLLVFSSTPDAKDDNFVVPLLLESPEKLAARAVELGFDGLEFLPNPNDLPESSVLERQAEAAGATVSVINSGRLVPNGYAIFHRDSERRRLSIDVFKRLIDLGGALGARVGLGMARGDNTVAASEPDLTPIMRDVLGEIAEHAANAGTRVMLEPADPGYVAAVLRVHEAVEQAEALNHPGLSIMLDTYQLDQVEDSIDGGFENAKGLASHIHLYDHDHWPPGVREREHRLDWATIRKSMKRHGFSGSGSMVLVPQGDVDVSMRQATAFVRDTLMTEEES